MNNDKQREESRLVSENIGLVVAQALKFKPTRVTDIDDYIQAGSIGLIKAIRKYNPEKGALSSFAWPSIWREIVHEVNKFKDNTTSLSFDPYIEYVDSISDSVPELSEQQLEIFQLRVEGHTLKEIGDKFDKTKEWVRQQLKSIIEEIKKANES
jgi:RNA polymerase sigma factor (sigma-70 family)